MNTYSQSGSLQLLMLSILEYVLLKFNLSFNLSSPYFLSDLESFKCLPLHFFALTSYPKYIPLTDVIPPTLHCKTSESYLKLIAKQYQTFVAESF